MKVFFTIDPGSAGAAISVWDEDKLFERVGPLNVFLLEKEGTWLETIKYHHSFVIGMIESLKIIDENIEIGDFYCEYPAFFDSAKGMQAAGEGSLVKLSISVGVFSAIAFNYKSNFIPIRVIDWKGQMSKEAIINRIKKTIPEHDFSGIKSHCWDSVGIGLYVKGLFNV